VWFRLLRTLLDEVSMAPSRVGTRSAATMEHIWHATGHPARAGLNVWRPCEQLGWPRQTMILEAAAAALHLAEPERSPLAARSPRSWHVNRIGPPTTATGPHLRPATGNASGNARRRRSTRHSRPPAPTPGAARQMLTLSTFSCRTLAAFHRERQHLIGTGHPRATPLRPP